MTPELDEKLSALLDDELSAEEAEALRDEIARRPELAGRLAELAAVDAGLRALPGRPVPLDLRARVGARVHAERMASSRRAPPSRRLRWLPAAAAIAAAAALVFVVLTRLGPGSESDLDLLAEELLPSSAAPNGDLEEDLPVIAVLDVLAELEELEGAG